MGLELAKAYVSIRGDASKLPNDLEATKKTAASYVTSISSMFSTPLGSALVAVDAVLSGIVRKLAIINRIVIPVSAAFATLFSLATVKKGIGLASEFEQTSVAFETILGSASKAKETLNDLLSFAASTPFEISGLTEASKTLLAFQVTQKDLLPTLKALGDISAGTGKDLGELAVIFGQIKSKGKLQGGELLQLAEAGVPIISALANQFGVAESAIADMVSKGKVGFKDVEQALMSMSAAGGTFFNLMEKQSRTVGGLWSTLKDNLAGLLREFFIEIQPVTKELLNLGLAITGSLTNSLDASKEGIKDFSSTWSIEINAMTRQFERFLELVKTGFSLFLYEAQDVGRQLAGVGEGFWIMLSSNMWETDDKLKEFMQDLLQPSMMTQAARVEFDVLKRALKQGMTETRSELKAAMQDAADDFSIEDTDFVDAIAAGMEDAFVEAFNDIPDKFVQDAVVGDVEKPKFIAGFESFSQAGRSLQERILQQDQDNQQKIINLLEVNNQFQERILNAQGQERAIIQRLGLE